jgi:hypothetical protein
MAFDGSRSIGSPGPVAVVAVALLLGVGGCAPPQRRIPYIPPDRDNWSEAYTSPAGLRLHVFTTTGSLEPPWGLLGGSWGERASLEVPVFVIDHPRAGLILVGTGLSPALAEAPQVYLGWLVAAVLQPTVEVGQDVVAQMRAAGLDPDGVARVILPDCRVPNTGQVGRFGSAKVTVATAEHAWALGAGASVGVDATEMLLVRQWDAVALEDAPPLATVPHAIDLLEDGSVWLLGLPGYTPGTMAVLVRLASGPVILAGGVVPLSASLRTPQVPAVAVDPDEWWVSAWRLKRFRELIDGVVVVPGFEPTVLARDARSDVALHEPDVDETEDEPAADRPAARDRRRPQPRFPVLDPPSSPPPMGR